jgi:hypothetical protein
VAFSKIAFLQREHRTITAYVMGDSFEAKLFQEVNSYIDSRRGFAHREQHGHDAEAETYIKQTWGDKGVEIFRLHILSDWLHDNLGPVVAELRRHLNAGDFPLPYYTRESRDSRPQYPVEARDKLGCSNCGSEEIDIVTWFRPLCLQCRSERNLESCVQCQNLFSNHDRIESLDNPGKFICPVCKAEDDAN